jgi:hypothetical protein
VCRANGSLAKYASASMSRSVRSSRRVSNIAPVASRVAAARHTTLDGASRAAARTVIYRTRSPAKRVQMQRCGYSGRCIPSTLATKGDGGRIV